MGFKMRLNGENERLRGGNFSNDILKYLSGHQVGLSRGLLVFIGVEEGL